MFVLLSFGTTPSRTGCESSPRSTPCSSRSPPSTQTPRGRRWSKSCSRSTRFLPSLFQRTPCYLPSPAGAPLLWFSTRGGARRAWPRSTTATSCREVPPRLSLPSPPSFPLFPPLSPVFPRCPPLLPSSPRPRSPPPPPPPHPLCGLSPSLLPDRPAARCQLSCGRTFRGRGSAPTSSQRSRARDTSSSPPTSSTRR